MSIPGKMYYWGDSAKYIPDKPGVYAFYDKNQTLIYVGKSDNLRQEFAKYLEEDFSNNLCKREVHYYKREFTSKTEDRMTEILEEYKREHNGFPKCNSVPELPLKTPPIKGPFHFYEDLGRPLNKVAYTLEDFKKRINEVPLASLEFHQKRGDFTKWIRDVFEKAQLAESIGKIEKMGENLRRELLNSFDNSESAQCPECGAMNNPTKTWKMAGKPSKAGERLQLKIGYYKCGNCTKAFRQVLAKEKIKAQ